MAGIEGKALHAGVGKVEHRTPVGVGSDILVVGEMPRLTSGGCGPSRRSVSWASRAGQVPAGSDSCKVTSRTHHVQSPQWHGLPDLKHPGNMCAMVSALLTIRIHAD